MAVPRPVQQQLAPATVRLTDGAPPRSARPRAVDGPADGHPNNGPAEPGRATAGYGAAPLRLALQPGLTPFSALRQARSVAPFARQAGRNRTGHAVDDARPALGGHVQDGRLGMKGGQPQPHHRGASLPLVSGSRPFSAAPTARRGEARHTHNRSMMTMPRRLYPLSRAGALRMGIVDSDRKGTGYVPVSGELFSRPDEQDDELHNPRVGHPRVLPDWKGVLNVLVLAAVYVLLLGLFGAYPVLVHLLPSGSKAIEALALNGTGMLPNVPIRQLVDPDTPRSAHQWSGHDGARYVLVFSDEFEVEGRTFWPGDDPFWEAVGMFYGATGDYEWYAPEAINTTGGALQITMTQKETHGRNFQSGMLQSWNKVCFQGGYLEMSIKLPGRQETRGFWPGLWTMGNLGRAGYLGSTDGMWPYSYAACDWGTLPNQTNPEGTAPYKALHANGLWTWQTGGNLSYLPGMRTSSCTCPGEDHPGPSPSVGRSAPEIDLVEAQNTDQVGRASQSLQVAPFDTDYWWRNASATFHGRDTVPNAYTGSAYQEAVSALSPIPAEAYTDHPLAEYTTFGVEVVPDWGLNGQGSITWYIGGKPTWTAPSAVVPADPTVNISRRIVPVEPMSIIINLGLSPGFQAVHFDELDFPARMQVDYVRLYQNEGEKASGSGSTSRTSCDPPDHPTAQYIADHLDLYTNPNHTVFPRHLYRWPKNRLLHPCD